jgi:hypothetical protein
MAKSLCAILPYHLPYQKTRIAAINNERLRMSAERKPNVIHVKQDSGGGGQASAD